MLSLSYMALCLLSRQEPWSKPKLLIRIHRDEVCRMPGCLRARSFYGLILRYGGGFERVSLDAVLVSLIVSGMFGCRVLFVLKQRIDSMDHQIPDLREWLRKTLIAAPDS